jgi:antitoxin ParD1/3/4
MATMNISLPDELRDFVEHQVTDGAYVSASEFVRELIRRERAAATVRALVLDGLESPVEGVMNDEFFASLRSRHRPAR